jgi:HAD superfamily hydrolase (TIGR01509 family)
VKRELKALFFDFDGTIAETERHGHRVAYQAAFDELGLGWTWDEALYGELLAVAGGKERIAAFVRERGAKLPDGADPRATIERIHRLKGERFATLAPSIPLRPGVARLIREAKSEGLRVAIVTTAAPEGVEALLEGRSGLRAAIDLIAAGDIVPNKKPAPDIYRFALEALHFAPGEAIAIEDSALGLRAALAAGVPTLITRSSYTLEDDFAGALAVVDDLGEPDAPARVVTGPAPSRGYVDLAYLRRITARSGH